MKNFLVRLRLFWRALATLRPWYWLRAVWRAKSAPIEQRRAEAVAALDALPQADSAPLPFARMRQLSRAFCADHCGLGFRLPSASPAAGFFWKRDAQGQAWRLYRERT